MTGTLRRLFHDHPASVGESYWEHFRVASWFAGTMAMGAMAAFIHAVVPGWCCRTGSDAVRRMHDRMVVNRHRHTGRAATHPSARAEPVLEWVI